MPSLSRQLLGILAALIGCLVVVGCVAAGLLVQDSGIALGAGESRPASPLAAVEPAGDGLRYLTREDRIEHQVAFRGFGWTGGRHVTVVREEALGAYADPAVSAWNAALPDLQLSVRDGDGCAWQALAVGEVGFCRVEIPYGEDEAWDATTDVVVDLDRGIHKARVRMNFFSTVLTEANELSIGLATHEFGHVLGLQHPRDPNECGSVMSYCFEVPEPSARDVAAVTARLRLPHAGR